MKLNPNKQNEINLTLSREELVLLGNSINEALELVDEWEFQTRTGESRKRAMEMLDNIRNILEEFDKGNNSTEKAI